MSDRPNPLKLNPLQLKTLTILQALARSGDYAEPPTADGSVLIRSIPHAHGDHFHIGAAVASTRDATGLGNPAVYGALQRKGLAQPGPGGRPMLTAAGLAYNTGLADKILYHPDH